MTSIDLPELSDRFTIFENIGDGGIGSVFHAYDQTLKRDVAIKVLHDIGDGVRVARFQREASMAGKLRHENIVALHDFGIAGNKPYLIMEYVRGRELRDILENEGPLDLNRFDDIVMQLCSALEHAHSQGILHRDIKPENIIVENIGGAERVKLVDFGLAKLVDPVQTLTRAGVALGTPCYISPEVISGGAVDERADVYSLGCVMFECLTGKPPFRGDSVNATLAKHLEEDVPSITSVTGKPGTDTVDSIVAKALSKAPEDRYQSIAALRSAIESISRTEILPTSLQAPSSTKSFIEKKLLVATCTVTIAVSLVIFLASALSPTKHESTPKKIAKPPEGLEGISASVFTDVDIIQVNSGTKLTDQDIAAGIRTMGSALRRIEISDRDVTDDQCLAMSDLPNVKSVLLARGRISDAGISRLLKLKVTEFGLISSNVNDAQLNGIGKMKALETLALTGNSRVTGKTLNQLKKSANLVRLDISSTGVAGKDLVSFSEQKPDQLKNLNIGNLRLNDADIKKLRLGQLKTLVLSANPITDAAIAYVAQTSKLHNLHLNYCPKLTEASLEEMRHLKLQYLSLAGTNIKNLQALENQQELKELDLHDSAIDDESIKTLPELKKLALLNLNNTGITRKSITQLLRLAHTTKILAIGCENLTEQDRSTLTSNGKGQIVTSEQRLKKGDAIN